MLLLKRKIGKSIEIQVDGMEPMIVSVLGIEGKEVCLGIAAPREVAVHRSEIADKIRLKEGGGLGIDREKHSKNWRNDDR